MKVEIGESLVFCWLRHVQGCPIVQTNWKPSPTWPIRRETRLATGFEKMRGDARQRLGFKLFKKSPFHQFLRQTEIDVLGLRFADARSVAIAVDSAFHENGVNYGALEETVGRILKKLIRATFALEVYFELHQADIIFVTPKMHNAVRNAIQSCWPDLQSTLSACGGLSVSRLDLRIVANADFVEQVLRPVLGRVDQVADTGELFMRISAVGQLLRDQFMEPADAFRFAAAGKRQRAQDRRTCAPNNGAARRSRAPYAPRA